MRTISVAIRSLLIGLLGVAMLAPTASGSPVSPRSQDAVVSKCLQDGTYPGNFLFSVHNSSLNRDFPLYCNDGPNAGVLHIDAGHDIPLSQTGEFSRCVTRLIAFGSYVYQTDGSIYWHWSTPSGIEARGYTDRASSGHIRTVFTSGNVSNQWTACGY